MKALLEILPSPSFWSSYLFPGGIQPHSSPPSHPFHDFRKEGCSFLRALHKLLSPPLRLVRDSSTSHRGFFSPMVQGLRQDPTCRTLLLLFFYSLPPTLPAPHYPQILYPPKKFWDWKPFFFLPHPKLRFLARPDLSTFSLMDLQEEEAILFLHLIITAFWLFFPSKGTSFMWLRPLPPIALEYFSRPSSNPGATRVPSKPLLNIWDGETLSSIWKFERPSVLGSFPPSRRQYPQVPPRADGLETTVLFPNRPGGLLPFPFLFLTKST